jgi:hypothetical protein
MIHLSVLFDNRPQEHLAGWQLGLVDVSPLPGREDLLRIANNCFEFGLANAAPPHFKERVWSDRNPFCGHLTIHPQLRA